MSTSSCSNKKQKSVLGASSFPLRQECLQQDVNYWVAFCKHLNLQHSQRILGNPSSSSSSPRQQNEDEEKNKEGPLEEKNSKSRNALEEGARIVPDDKARLLLILPQFIIRNALPLQWIYLQMKEIIKSTLSSSSIHHQYYSNNSANAVVASNSTSLDAQRQQEAEGGMNEEGKGTEGSPLLVSPSSHTDLDGNNPSGWERENETTLVTTRNRKGMKSIHNEEEVGEEKERLESVMLHTFQFLFTVLFTWSYHQLCHQHNREEEEEMRSNDVHNIVDNDTVQSSHLQPEDQHFFDKIQIFLWSKLAPLLLEQKNMSLMVELMRFLSSFLVEHTMIQEERKEGPLSSTSLGEAPQSARTTNSLLPYPFMLLQHRLQEHHENGIERKKVKEEKDREEGTTSFSSSSLLQSFLSGLDSFLLQVLLRFPDVEELQDRLVLVSLAFFRFPSILEKNTSQKSKNTKGENGGLPQDDAKEEEAVNAENKSTDDKEQGMKITKEEGEGRERGEDYHGGKSAPSSSSAVVASKSKILSALITCINLHFKATFGAILLLFYPKNKPLHTKHKNQTEEKGRGESDQKAESRKADQENEKENESRKAKEEEEVPLLDAKDFFLSDIPILLEVLLRYQQDEDLLPVLFPATHPPHSRQEKGLDEQELADWGYVPCQQIVNEVIVLVLHQLMPSSTTGTVQDVKEWMALLTPFLTKKNYGESVIQKGGIDGEVLHSELNRKDLFEMGVDVFEDVEWIQRVLSHQS